MKLTIFSRDSDDKLLHKFFTFFVDKQQWFLTRMSLAESKIVPWSFNVWREEAREDGYENGTFSLNYTVSNEFKFLVFFLTRVNSIFRLSESIHYLLLLVINRITGQNWEHRKFSAIK